VCVSAEFSQKINFAVCHEGMIETVARYIFSSIET
jgi:hypothetical protein